MGFSYTFTKNMLALSAIGKFSIHMYWVTGYDVAQEIEKWAKLAALGSTAHSVHFSVPCAASSPVSQ